MNYYCPICGRSFKTIQSFLKHFSGFSAGIKSMKTQGYKPRRVDLKKANLHVQIWEIVKHLANLHFNGIEISHEEKRRLETEYKIYYLNLYFYFNYIVNT